MVARRSRGKRRRIDSAMNRRLTQLRQRSDWLQRRIGQLHPGDAAAATGTTSGRAGSATARAWQGDHTATARSSGPSMERLTRQFAGRLIAASGSVCSRPCRLSAALGPDAERRGPAPRAGAPCARRHQPRIHAGARLRDRHHRRRRGRARSGPGQPGQRDRCARRARPSLAPWSMAMISPDRKSARSAGGNDPYRRGRNHGPALKAGPRTRPPGPDGADTRPVLPADASGNRKSVSAPITRARSTVDLPSSVATQPLCSPTSNRSMARDRYR